MRTCDSVDFPDPLGPITACTSPERTTRSMPFRMSRPPRPARNPSIRSSLIVARDLHDHVAVDHVDRVHGYRLRGGQRLRRTVDKGERAAVLPALDLLL